MRKVHSIKTIMLNLCVSIFFALLSIFLLINYCSNNIIILLSMIFIAIAVCLIIVIFELPNYIEISQNNIRVYNFPLLATNRFYNKKRSLIIWNNEIDSSEVEMVEIVQLTKIEKIKYVGYKHLFSKYLRIYIKNNNAQKYVYISIYTKKQINEIIRCFNIEKTKK